MISTLALGLYLVAPPLPKLDWSLPARYKHGTVLNRAPAFESKVVALTFDDGPDPQITPRVLDALKAHNIKATFFVLGPQAKRYPRLLRRMVREGHCIANHTWTHSKATTKDQAVTEIMRTNAVVRKATGNSPTLFRPPYGIRSGEYAIQAKAMGMPVVLWTRIDNDSRAKSVQQMLDAIGTPKNGDIILCHDGPGRKTTAKMLPYLLNRLKKAKYEFATVPQLLRKFDRHLVELEKRQLASHNPTQSVRKPLVEMGSLTSSTATSP